MSSGVDYASGMHERIAAILAEVLGLDAGTITPDQELAGDLGVDSLTMIEVVLGIEQESGVVVPDGEVASFRTVGDLASYVEGELRQTT
jgi:acyl carrier protein